VAKKAKSKGQKKGASKSAKGKAASSKAKLHTWVASLADSEFAAAEVAALRAVSFSGNNPNVLVIVSTAGQSSVVPCAFNLPVGIYPLHYNAQGSGAFNVTVTGAQVSHPIGGVAPKAATILIKVS